MKTEGLRITIETLDGRFSVTFPAGLKGQVTIKTNPPTVLQTSGEAVLVNGQAVPDSTWTLIEPPRVADLPQKPV